MVKNNYDVFIYLKKEKENYGRTLEGEVMLADTKLDGSIKAEVMVGPLPARLCRILSPIFNYLIIYDEEELQSLVGPESNRSCHHLKREGTCPLLTTAQLKQFGRFW